MPPYTLLVLKEHVCHHALHPAVSGMLKTSFRHKGTASVLLKTVQAARSQSTITGSKE